MGGMFGGLFGGGAEAGGAAASEGASMAMDFIPLLFAAKGGLVPDIGMSGIATEPISKMVDHYAKGGKAPAMGASGIATDNTIVNVGENAPSQFEAVVPLPDNRTLPVTITDKSMPYKPPSDSGATPTMVAAAMPEMPQPIVHVQMLGDMVNPASKGMTPQESIQVWIENVKKDGAARQAVKEIVGR